MSKNKEISALEVFTEAMFSEAKKCQGTTEIQTRVIEPNMEHINKVTGQENDPRYWAYAMEFTLNQIKLKEKFQ